MCFDRVQLTPIHLLGPGRGGRLPRAEGRPWAGRGPGGKGQRGHDGARRQEGEYLVN